MAIKITKEQMFELGGATYHVKAPEFLQSLQGEQVVIVLAVSRCLGLIESLNQLENLKNCSCYILPMMCLSNFTLQEKMSFQESAAKIPKKIHYIWLGGKAIPATLQRCIDSWKKYCPDYEIIQWNENNYDISKNAYMREAYENKAYGFVPDYARLDILYNYGGIYMDTDVELIKPLDDLLGLEAFCCVEKWQTINFGGCSGAVAHHQMIKRFLDARKDEHYIDKDGRINKNTCGYTDTKTAIHYGYQLNGLAQKVENMMILPYEFFHPYDYMSGRCLVTENTHGIHHFNGGWLDENLRSENEKIRESFNELERAIH